MKPITPEQRERLAGRFVIASLSGGKDSTALCLWLKENGIPFRAVFMDTGWEADETYAYLRETLPAFVGEITWIRAARQMEELCLYKAMFPTRMVRWCTELLKIKPMQAYLSGVDEEVVGAVGIRHAESKARARMPEWEWSGAFDCETWRPLIHWTEQDVIDTHTRHGCPPNPLYLKGAQRVGCWPCIYARKAEIRFIADNDPARIDRLRVLEERVAAAHLEKVQTRGDEYRPEGRPAWFQPPSADAEGRYPSWPIDKVIQWSRTSRGGRQFELFAAPESEAGCMRWGLCETSGGADD